MLNRIIIIGPVGSGKSTLARRLARDYGLTHCELDAVVHEPDPDRCGDNRKRPEAERDALFQVALSQPRWVLEDTGRALFESGWQAADSIILLEPSAALRRYRIVSRWIKQNLGLEPCAYKPDLRMLRLMFKWTRNFESGADGLKRRLGAYGEKVSVIRGERDVRAFEEAHMR